MVDASLPPPPRASRKPRRPPTSLPKSLLTEDGAATEGWRRHEVLPAFEVPDSVRDAAAQQEPIAKDAAWPELINPKVSRLDPSTLPQAPPSRQSQAAYLAGRQPGQFSLAMESGSARSLLDAAASRAVQEPPEEEVHSEEELTLTPRGEDAEDVIQAYEASMQGSIFAALPQAAALTTHGLARVHPAASDADPARCEATKTQQSRLSRMKASRDAALAKIMAEEMEKDQRSIKAASSAANSMRETVPLHGPQDAVAAPRGLLGQLYSGNADVGLTEGDESKAAELGKPRSTRAVALERLLGHGQSSREVHIDDEQLAFLRSQQQSQDVFISRKRFS